MTMTVADLKDMLADFDDGAEVRFASQPSLPMEYSLNARAVGPDEVGEFAEGECGECGAEGCDDVRHRADAPNVVYLAEGTQLGYLPGAVAMALDWR